MVNNQLYNFLQIPDEEHEYKEEMLKAFGRNLKNLRISRGLTQEKLGEISQINYKYIGEIERGEKNPTAFVLYRVAQALDVSVDEILTIKTGLSKDKTPENDSQEV